MHLTLELSDEQAAALKAKAAAQGLTVEGWLQKLAVQDISHTKHRYSLSELLEQCDASAPLSAEDRAWIDAPAVGREA